MPLVLAGATSGSATVQATDAATVTLTLPATSGTLALSTGGGSPTFTSITTTNDSTISGLTVGKGASAVATNTVVGNTALASNTSGSNNLAVGNYALYLNTTGQYNTAVGSQDAATYAPLFTNSSGGYNTAIGTAALASNTTASNNTAIGYQSGFANTTGRITAVGHRVLYANTTGSGNTGMGGNDGSVGSALLSNTTGSYNIAIGTGSLQNNTTASNNTAVGYQAGYSNTTAAETVSIGNLAGYSNQTGPGNVCIGHRAGYSVTAGYSVIIGTSAGGSGTGGSNTLVGYNAGAGLTTGYGNTFIGPNYAYAPAGAITTGSLNTIIGGFSGNNGGLDIRTSNNYIVLSDGAGNPRIWCNDTGRWLLNGTQVVDVARLSVSFDGANSTGIGFKATAASGGTFCPFWNNNNVSVGQIATNGTTTTYTTTSDYRLKENVAPMTNALATVQALKPVTYTWKSNGLEGQGFIAHELQAIVPDCVNGEKDAVNEDGSIKAQGIDTSYLVATLTAAIQELNAKVTALEAQLGAK